MSALISGGEVISIHIGAAGGNIGSVLWQLIAKEHHLVTSLHVENARRKLQSNVDADQRQKFPYLQAGRYQGNLGDQLQSGLVSQNLSVFFTETLQRHVPRAIFIDSDPSARFSGLFEPRSPLKHFFRPENFIFGRASSSGVRPRAVSEGVRVTQLALNSLTRELDLCDSVQAIQLTHHLGGGSGSGLGSLLMECLHDELGSKVLLMPTTLIPVSQDIGRRNNAVEVYNSVLSLPEVAEYSHLCSIVDNSALYDICFRLVGLSDPGWRDLNHIIGSVMCGFSSCMRFPSIHSNMPSVSRLHAREMVSTLAVPNLPFVTPGFAPLTNRAANAPLGALLLTGVDSSELGKKPLELCYQRAGTRMPSVGELCRSLFRPSHLLASVDPLGHSYLSALAVFRGLVEPDEIEQEINYNRLNNIDRYREWTQAMPTTINTKICPESDVGLNLSVSWAGVTTATSVAIRNLIQQYEKLLLKKAFVHVYLNEGIEEFELFDKLDLCKEIVELYDTRFGHAHTSRVEAYETRRDMGTVTPFQWEMGRSAVVTFDPCKTVKLNW